jgi:hypothetical protein
LENISSSEPNEDASNNNYYYRRREWKGCATLVEGGTCSNKLAFGADAKIDEGKGSKEKQKEEEEEEEAMIKCSV